MAKLKNIVFDLGGVILTLNMEQAYQAFERIGMKDARQRLNAYVQTGLFADLEAGRSTIEEFRAGLSRMAGRPLSTQDCYEAVHAYVSHVPQKNLPLLQRLRQEGYQVCLLSNTNPLMMQWVESPAFDGQGHPVSYYFDRLYLSYEMGIMKPAPEIFKMMLEGQQAKPEETLFIDDSAKNCEVAESLGIRTLCPKQNEDLSLYPEIQALFRKDNSEELFPIVDEEGRVVGKATRGECHSGSFLLHPVVHLHVFNSRGEVYLQKRPEWKDIQPGKWDTAVGGHIDYGETPEQALRREVGEELGIRDFSAERVGMYVFESRRERELVYVHKTVYDGPVSPSAEELDGGRFWTLAEIRSAIGRNILTPNFESEFQRFFL